MKGKTLYLFMFLIGLFADVRVHLIGMIGISEIVIVLMAPFLFARNYPLMKRDGFMPLFNLLVLTTISCCVSSWLNHTPFPNFMRGIASPIVLTATVVFMHHFLRKDLVAMKWFMFGYILCGLLTIVIGGDAADVLMSDEYAAGVLRMYTILPIFLLPVYVFYTQVPTVLCCALCGGVGIYTIAASASGRSAALTFLAGALLIFIGQKSVRKMAKIKRNFLFFLVLSLVAVFVAKVTYSHAAASGVLGETARLKYEKQTRSGGGMLRLLMGGRSEVFVGILAALDKPMLGHGPWAVDIEGYGRRFQDKYGDDEDVAERLARERYRQLMGLPELYSYIPCHSHIVGYWVWYGIVGLCLWGYVLCLIVKYFQKYVDVMPQWYGMMALVLPKLCWDIFFSPLFARVETATVLCCLLFVRALYNGKMNYSSAAWAERQLYLP